jgi:hypothetical protein
MDTLSSNQPRIAEGLLTLLASGGTLERLLAELPEHHARIASAFEWMKANAQCKSAEIGQRAARLGELIAQKDQAVKEFNFALAVSLLDEECALYASLGLQRPGGESWYLVMHVGVDDQMRRLAALLQETKAPQAAS